MCENKLDRLVALVKSDQNRSHDYAAAVTTDNSRTNRNIPSVEISSPWGGVIDKELPEYVHMSSGGVEHLLSGRAPDKGIPVKGQPQWIDKSGELHLDAEFEGGIFLRYRVSSCGPYVETRWGISNESPNPLKRVWFQCCTHFDNADGFRAHSPDTSRFIIDGEFKSWLDYEYHGAVPKSHPDWKINIWMSLYLANTHVGCLEEREREIAESLHRPQRKVSKVLCGLPFVMKTSSDNPGRHVVLYSPSCRDVFYNPSTPCMHAEPWIGDIAVAETKWTSEYTMYFDGAPDLLKGAVR